MSRKASKRLKELDGLDVMYRKVERLEALVITHTIKLEHDVPVFAYMAEIKSAIADIESYWQNHINVVRTMDYGNRAEGIEREEQQRRRWARRSRS